MRDVLVGVDVGTSACKVTAFTAEGTELASASAGYPVHAPRPGWVEQDAGDWWRAARDGLARVMADPGVDPGRVAGVGVAGQSWSAVPLSGDGEVLARTPIWMDTRAADLCREAETRVGAERILALSGNRLSPSYSTGKILWFRRHRPEVYARTRWFLQSNAYVVRQLTGAVTQDRSQAYGLHVVDVRTGGYDERMCDALGIDRDRLPDLVDCHQVVGQVSASVSRDTGLAAGTPVVAGGLDAVSGALGAGVHHTGQVQEQGGQAGGMSIVVDRPVADRRLILSRHVVPGAWMLQGGTAAGGASLRWLVDVAGDAERRAARSSGRSAYEEVSDLAGKVPPCSDGVVFLPYLAGERSPLWDPDARGVYYGLTLSTGRGHLYRAAMEGVAFSLRHNLEVAEECGVAVGDMHAVGGAAGSTVWTQIKADVTGRTLHVAAGDTATTLGAALLAGMGTGVFPDWDEAVARTVRIRRSLSPDPLRRPGYDEAYRVYRELYRLLAPLMAGPPGPASGPVPASEPKEETR
jgi:xylulokinase